MILIYKLHHNKELMIPRKCNQQVGTNLFSVKSVDDTYTGFTFQEQSKSYSFTSVFGVSWY